MGIAQISPRIGSFIARAAFVLPALVAPASGVASLTACSGTVEGPCQKMGERVCERRDIAIEIRDDRTTAYTDAEKSYIKNQTLNLFNKLPSCFPESLSSILFKNHVELPYPTSSEPAGAHVCETREYSNGDKSSSCYIEISTHWMDKEKTATIEGVPHFWLFNLMHEVMHGVILNLAKTCNNDGYMTISFDEKGNPKSANDADFIDLFSFFPNFHLDQSKQSPKEDLANGGASYVFDGKAFLNWKEASTPLADKWSTLGSFYFNSKDYLSDNNTGSKPMSLPLYSKFGIPKCIEYTRGNKTISAMMIEDPKE